MKTHFLNIEDLSPKEIQALIKRAREIKKNPRLSNKKLAGKVIASLFFEPSTRTRLSFESAALRLGAGVIGFADPLTTSYGGKGESFLDTIRIISGYADLIIIRHPKAGAAQKAAKVSSVPVINAGDGPNQHPTQTLLDLMAIQETQKKINNLNIALMGDLKYARVPRSLALALAQFKNIKLFLVSPSELKMKNDVLEKIKGKIQFHNLTGKNNLLKIMPRLDILYLIRIQKERLGVKLKERPPQITIFTPGFLKNAKPNLKILHCLPRTRELDRRIDKTPFAYYFEQAKNGLWIRMALLEKILKNTQ